LLLYRVSFRLKKLLQIFTKEIKKPDRKIPSGLIVYFLNFLLFSQNSMTRFFLTDQLAEEKQRYYIKKN